MSVGNCGDRVGDLPATGVCELTTGDRGKIAGGKEDRRGEKETRRGEDHQGKSPGNNRREESPREIAGENFRSSGRRRCVGAGILMIVGFWVVLI